MLRFYSEYQDNNEIEKKKCGIKLFIFFWQIREMRQAASKIVRQMFCRFDFILKVLKERKRRVWISKRAEQVYKPRRK